MINYLRDLYQTLELRLTVRAWVVMVKVEEHHRGRRVVGGLRKHQGEWELDLHNVAPGSEDWAADRWSISERGSIDAVAQAVVDQEESKQLPSTSWYDAHKPVRSTA